jgi:hypothetical protein
MNKMIRLIIICSILCIAVVSLSQAQKEIVIKEIKPTLSGYINTAFVMTDKVGQDKKEMTVFRRNEELKAPLVAAKGGLVWGGSVPFGISDVKKLSGDAHIAIDGDTEFAGNLDYDQSTYTFLRTVRLAKHVFYSDEKEPLVFKLVKDKGFVYLKGKGKITPPSGEPITIP